MKKLAFLAGLMLLPVMVFSAVGSANIGDQKTFTLEEMLTYSIEDELSARAQYEVIIEELGGGRPFTNIVEAEKTHIEYLEPLLIKYQVEYPEAPDKVMVPASLTEAYETGVEAEIANIAMYNRFLSEDLPEDVREIFTRLRDASENHLRAFERQTVRQK